MMTTTTIKRAMVSIFLAWTALNAPAMAQERIPVQLKDFQVSLSILEPSLSLEKRLTDNNSLTVSAGLTTLSQVYEDQEYDVLSINPVVQADLRNYYPRRKVKKDLDPNSGNYIGLLGGYNFGSIADNGEQGTVGHSNAFFMGGVWGIQRNYKSGIHLGLALGAGFITGQHTDLDLTGLWSFRLGFVLK